MMLKPSVMVDPEQPLQPRLKVVGKRCPNLCREMLTYRYPKRLTEGVNVQAPKQDPIKDDDHAVDAMRYGIFTELNMRGATPSTLAKEHSTTESAQFKSEKFKRRRRREPPQDGRPFGF